MPSEMARMAFFEMKTLNELLQKRKNKEMKYIKGVYKNVHAKRTQSYLSHDE